ncbi:MAG: hypothetical protein KJN99_05275 [Marinicaulis sp.]|nr:hypothetical protein [Marinicaulis sp.]
MTENFSAIICGLKSEADAVRSAVSGDDIRIYVSGANAVRAEELAQSACADGAKAIISIGVSGGLDPSLKPGQLIIGDEILSDCKGAIFASDPFLLGALRKTQSFEDARVGRLFGADTIIVDAKEKAALFARTRAIAVDMESHGAARAAAEAKIPFVAIRAVADPADRALPKAALGAVAPDGSTLVAKTLGAAMRDPKQFPGLIRLGSDSSKAIATLKRDLPALLRVLFSVVEG